MSQIGEPVVVLGMVHDEQHAQVLSNVMQYAASRRADKAWKGKMAGALEDRSKTGGDPPFVRLKPSYFEWRKVRLLLDQEDSGPMATFYDQPENEGEFCSLNAGELEMNETAVPKLALVPSKIAADALEVGYTPWEVHDALVDFKDGKRRCEAAAQAMQKLGAGRSLEGQPRCRDEQVDVRLDANCGGAHPTHAGHES